DRIIPAEILEIDEAQLSVLGAQRIVQSEVRGAQGTMRRSERSCRIPPQARIALLKAPNRCRARGNQTAFDEATQVRKFARYVLQSLQPSPILSYRFQWRKSTGGSVAQSRRAGGLTIEPFVEGTATGCIARNRPRR